MKKKFLAFILFLQAIPAIALGAGTDQELNVCAKIGAPFGSLTEILDYASCILIKPVMRFLFILATVAFIWGVIQYFLNAENEEKRKKGKSFMLWGIIALFVMVSVWGLVGVLSNTFGTKTLIPQLSQ
jgi:hypothetical protein